MTAHVPPVLYSADFSGCKAISQLTESEISEMFAMVLQSAGATIVHARSYVHEWSAMTCAVILTESHAVLHVWPDTGAMNVDIFCCSTRLKALQAIEDLRWVFGARNARVHEVLRDADTPTAES